MNNLATQPLVVQGVAAYTQKAANGSEIWISDISPEAATVVYQSAHQQLAYWPRSSNDGRQLAYLVQDANKENYFWLLDMNNLAPRQLTQSGVGQAGTRRKLSDACRRAQADECPSGLAAPLSVAGGGR